MDLVGDGQQHRALADLLDRPTAMNVPAVAGSRYVSSSADVTTASVPAAKKPSTTSSVVR